MGTSGARVSVKYVRSKLVKWDDLSMEIMKNPTENEIKKAAKALKDGHLVAFPTETVYGLGADATNEMAVSRIYSVKGRPTDHPLIIHICSINQLTKWAVDIPEYAIKLAKEFWPGPLTLILKRANIAKDFVTGGQVTVGLRVPSNPLALALLHEFEKISGSAIAAPSANRFGQVSPTSCEDVSEEIGMYLAKYDLLLDGGISFIGIESTIIDCTTDQPAILRSGYITKKDVESKLGIIIESKFGKIGMKFSGSFERHYAPKCQIILGSHTSQGNGFLALSEIETPPGMFRLASPTSVMEFARNLYSTFRTADRMGLNALIVTPPLGDGLAEAIADRLEKASLGRY